MTFDEWWDDEKQDGVRAETNKSCARFIWIDAQAHAARPEEVAQWRMLDDHTSTPSCTSVLSGERKQPFTHWFTTLYKGDFYFYKVEVPAFNPPQPQRGEGT